MPSLDFEKPDTLKVPPEEGDLVPFILKRILSSLSRWFPSPCSFIFLFASSIPAQSSG